MANTRSVLSADKKTLTITVDLTQTQGKSKSGKSTIVASTNGFQTITEDISYSINVIRKD